MRLIIGILALFVLADRGECSSVDNFTKTVSYTAPTNFYIHDYTDDNYPTPFSIGGSGIEYDHDPNSNILFELGMACYSIGESGNGVKFLPTKPADLKNDFETFYRGAFTNMEPARLSKMSGFTAVSFSTPTSPPGLGACFYYSCWIQIETNIVVKVSTTSCDAKIFNALTNSLQSLKINKKEILELVASQKQIALPFPRLK